MKRNVAAEVTAAVAAVKVKKLKDKTPNEKKIPKKLPHLPVIKIDLNKLDANVKKRLPKFNSEKELQNFIMTAIENEMNIEISPYLTIEELKALEKKANQ